MKAVRVLEKIVADGHVRRELLWLRAKEKGDEDVARDLERGDPEIVVRLQAAGLDVRDDADEPDAGRRERFARLSDECYERHAASLAATTRTSNTECQRGR